MNRTTIKKLIIAGVVTVCSMGLASQVDAISLTTSSAQFLGDIDPNGGSEADQAAQITHLVSLAPLGSDTFDGNDYDRSANVLCFPTCPAATDVGSFKTEVPSEGDNTGDFGSGWTYLKGKYGTHALVWYVAGLTGEFDIPSTTTDGGLSHWVLFNPSTSVSEPSTTLLMGLAFAGVAFFSRKFLPRA